MLAIPDASHIGLRISIRCTEGASFRDYLGVMRSLTTIEKRDGSILTFDPAQIVAWRIVEEATARAGFGAPTSIRIREIESVLTTTWPPLEVEIRGGWRYRAGAGYTYRANSVLPEGGPGLGDPLLSLADEVSYAIDFYRSRDITPSFNLPLPSYAELDDYLAANGWNIHLEAFAMVADRMEIEARTDCTVEISDLPSDLFQEVRGVTQGAAMMSAYPSHYLVLRDSQGTPCATGRISVAGEWGAITNLFVKPEFRGQGWSKVALRELISVVSASKFALQVDASNSVAINLYESLGFRKHHSYRFRTLLS
jgi:GNAT superfamily N-acetyltransferase